MTDLTQDCPFCKESIKADAIKCRYCGSWLGEGGPTHGGTCPFCKEGIKTDALKCKHCGSMLFGDAGLGANATMPGATWGLPPAFGPGWEPNLAKGLAYPGYAHCRWVPEAGLTISGWRLECRVR